MERWLSGISAYWAFRGTGRILDDWCLPNWKCKARGPPRWIAAKCSCGTNQIE